MADWQQIGNNSLSARPAPAPTETVNLPIAPAQAAAAATLQRRQQPATPSFPLPMTAPVAAETGSCGQGQTGLNIDAAPTGRRPRHRVPTVTRTRSPVRITRGVRVNPFFARLRTIAGRQAGSGGAIPTNRCCSPTEKR